MELSEREGLPRDFGARTLAIVVARCNRIPARSRGRLHVGDMQAYDGRFALDSARETHGTGTAEVLHRQLELLEALAPQRVLVIEADVLRGIDYAALIDAHIAAGIGATLAFAETSAVAGYGRGIVTVDGRGRVLRLGDAAEPPRGASHAGRPRFLCAGAYVLDRELLVDCLEVDAAEPTSGHDFRADVLPVLIRANGVAAHRVFVAEQPPVEPPAAASGVARRAVSRLPHGR